jgi:hypothetical protein
VARTGERIRAYKVLVKKSLGQSPLVGRDHRRENNIKTHIIEGGGHGLYSSTSGQGQVTGCWEHGGEPLGFVKCGKFFD